MHFDTKAYWEKVNASPPGSSRDRSDINGPVWTNDCQGKKDLDGSLVYVSSRYWPAGGGFSVYTNEGWQTNADLSIKPSGEVNIYFMGKVIRNRYFKGASQEEVQAAMQGYVDQTVTQLAAVLDVALESTL